MATEEREPQDGELGLLAMIGAGVTIVFNL